MSESSQSGNSGGGRYQRSPGGLVAALLVILLGIGAFVVFRDAVRRDLEVTPEPVDYEAVVAHAQERGLRPVHPRELPAGWTATSVELTPGEDPVWGMGVLTGEERFVGLRQEDAAPEDLLATYVDEEVEELGLVEVSGSVAREWRVYADEGGDHAYVAEVAGDTVVVYGSAPTAELEAFLTLLTR